METNLTCRVCGQQFIGRPNKAFCSLRCKRDVERRRRYFDQIGLYIETCERYAGNEELPDKLREEWRQRAEGARQRRQERFGSRP